MFIKMSTDAATDKAIIQLQQLYPNEKVILPQELGGVPKEGDGSLPKRITFFGHGGVAAFGNKNIDEFSNMMVSQLTSYAEKEPGIKKSLATIDLLGCNIGHHESNRTSFAAAVTTKVNKELQQKGFKEIQFNAATNLLSGQPESFSSTKLVHQGNQFSVKCIKSKEDESKITQCQSSIQTKKRGIARIENRIDLLDDKIANLQEQHQTISAQLAAKKNERTSKASVSQTVAQSASAVADSKSNKDSRIKRRTNREELRSINEKKESLEKSLVECNSNIEQTQRSFNAAEGKYHQNILQLGTTEDEKRALKSSIKQEVAKIHSDAVASSSKWISTLQHCLDELDSNKNADINASLSIVTKASQEIRQGWLGAASIFGPGSTSATKLETLTSAIVSKNSQLEAREKMLKEENANLKSQVNTLDKQLHEYEVKWQKLQAEDNVTERTKLRLEKEQHQYSSKPQDQKISKEIRTLEKQISILDTKISSLTTEKKELITNQEKLQTNIQQLKQKEDSLRTGIFRSESDPRKILDDPRCNFTNLIAREQQLGGTRAHRVG